MSLSFVSKSIQTSTDDGGFEETPIESKETDGISGRTSSTANSKPLFDQLRDNQEQDEAEREEFQRSIMRGTLALDEEDCAHLDALQRQKEARDMQVMQQTQDELAAFRAAKADRVLLNNHHEKQQQREDEANTGNDSQNLQDKTKELSTTARATIVPRIIVKKRRRDDHQTGASTMATTTSSICDASSINAKNPNAEQVLGKQEGASLPNAPSAGEQSSSNRGLLGGLLTGYGSSSSDDE